MTTAIKGQKLTSFGTTSVENGTTSSSFVRGADLGQLELFIPSGLTVNGTANPDSITIYDGDDVVNAGEGGDVIYDFGTGNDIIRGEGGNDWIFVGKGNDTVDGGLGRDGISYLYSEQIVGLDLEAGFALSEGIDTLISIEDASGGAGNDSLLGSSVDNYLYGADGNDRLDGRGGNDSLWGGAGNDTVVGGTGSDFVFGDYGNDTLDGGADVDTLWGGWGIDVMTGGAGGDLFLFNSNGDFSTDGLDVITDFQRGADKIDLRQIDARPDVAGHQRWSFDSSQDGATEEFFDGLSDDWSGIIATKGGPTINGDRGEIEIRHEDGDTFVFLSYGDGLTEASIKLEGTVHLAASDFLL